jgi:ferredoxin
VGVFVVSVDKDKCEGCETCVSVCSTGVVTLKEM